MLEGRNEHKDDFVDLCSNLACPDFAEAVFCERKCTTPDNVQEEEEEEELGPRTEEVTHEEMGNVVVKSELKTASRIKKKSSTIRTSHKSNASRKSTMPIELIQLVKYDGGGVLTIPGKRNEGWDVELILKSAEVDKSSAVAFKNDLESKFEILQHVGQYFFAKKNSTGVFLNAVVYEDCSKTNFPSIDRIEDILMKTSGGKMPSRRKLFIAVDMSTFPRDV
jgi:hypothetical protein